MLMLSLSFKDDSDSRGVKLRFVRSNRSVVEGEMKSIQICRTSFEMD